MFTFLSKLSLKQQILFGFMPVLIILVFFAYTSQEKFNAFHKHLIALAESSEQHETILNIEKDILELQRNVVVYSYVGYEGVLKKISFLQDRLEQKLSNIGPTLDGDDALADRFERLTDHYNNYKNRFDVAVHKKNQLNALKKDTLAPLSNRIHEILDHLPSHFRQNNDYENLYLLAKIERKFHIVQTNLIKFEERPDASLIHQTNSILDQIKEQTQTIKMQENAHDIDELVSIYKDYKAGFRVFVNLDRSYLQLINVVLAGKAAEIATLSKEIDEILDSQTHELQDIIATDLSDTQQSYLFLSVFASFIGFICAWYIAKGIARPVQNMAQALSDLSQGQTNIEIPGIERKDEIGRMAQAAHEFKAMSERVLQQSDLIEQSEKRLSAIVDNMVDGLFTTDEMGTIQSFNTACQTIFGYSSENVIGENIEMLMPSNNQTVTGLENEVVGQHKDGRIFPMDISVSDIVLGDNHIYTSIVRDITERQEAQRALTQANAELEEFAYRTSHDLRSPLLSSIALLGIARESLKNGETDQAIASMEHVTKSLEKLETLVQDILSLTQTKNLEEENLPIDFEDIVSECVEKFKHMPNYNRLSIEKNFSFSKKLSSKKTRITLIIENLFSNAVKYQDTAKDQSFIKLSTYEDDGYAVFRLEDNGLGIPKDQQENMFVMFKRFHPKTSFGSGLGLYMMKKSADIIGGVLLFEDSGDGCIFKLKIPMEKV